MITKHPYSSREEWLALRASFEGQLGGSELGVAAGHSKYNSPYALFCEKVGLTQQKDISDREAIIQGHDLEQYVADRFTRLTGYAVHEETCIFTNDETPHLKATPDRLLDDGESGLECKTVQSIVMNKFAAGDFPQSYYDQCACYLAVTRRKRWYLAMLVFGTAFKVFEMTTDKEESDEYQSLRQKVDSKAEMTEAERQAWEKRYSFLEALYFISEDELAGCEKVAAVFMSRVDAFKAGDVSAWPLDEIDGSDATEEAIRESNMANFKPQSVVTLDSAVEVGKYDDGTAYTALDLAKRYGETKDEISRLEEVAATIENQMATIVGDNETAYLPGWKITYKMSSTRKTASVPAVEHYFSALGKPVPDGMISVSTPKRGIRFWTQKEKTAKKK